MTSKTIEVPRELVERLTRVYPRNITDPVTIRTIQAQSVVAMDELRALLAAPEAPRQDNSALMKIAADLANRTPLRQLYLVCDTQSRIGVESLHEYLDKCGDLLASTALDIRRAITSQAAPLSPDHSGEAGKVVITMQDVMSALEHASGFPMLKPNRLPVLTSNQCHALATALNKVKELNQ